MESILFGVAISVIAGFLTGTFMWPMKIISTLKFEHYWFIGMVCGLLILPWAIVFLCAHDPIGSYKEVGLKTILTANLLSMGWGIANVLYGICIIRIGAGLAGAILTSLGITTGVLIPMVFKGTGQFSNTPDILSGVGALILIGLIIILIGVIFISLAGFGRDRYLKGTSEEQTLKKSSKFLSGFILAIIAGILSCCISLTFVYSQGPIIKVFKEHGTNNLVSSVAVWAGALSGGILVNLIYPAFLMTKNRNWATLLKFSKDTILAAVIGIQLMLGAIMLGQGMILLGTLGASIGFGIQQGMQIIGNQTVGFAAGEWKGIPYHPKKMLFIGLAIIFAGIAVLALFQGC
jgi:L-rhamnose-H+ transport protein